MPPFKKGDTRINRNGRPKAKQNRSTESIRAVFADFLALNAESLQADYDSLISADKRLTYLEKIARLILPPPMPIWERMTDEQFQEFLNELKENRAEPQ